MSPKGWLESNLVRVLVRVSLSVKVLVRERLSVGVLVRVRLIFNVLVRVRLSVGILVRVKLNVRVWLTLRSPGLFVLALPLSFISPLCVASWREL